MKGIYWNPTGNILHFDRYSILKEMYKRNHVFLCFLKICEIRYQGIRISYISERDPEPLQISRMDFFAKVVNS